jgi:hypothetical protein
VPARVAPALEDAPEDTQNPDAAGEPVEGKTDPNPLNPAGDSLDQLITMRMNEDLWVAMRGELPCLDISESCLGQLQSLAVANSVAIKAIDERVQIINGKIEEAKRNNQATVRLGVFEPLVQNWLQLEAVPVGSTKPRRGFLNRVFDLFSQPLNGVNEILSLVGVPLFKNAIGGDPNVQARSIAIADLQVKVAEVENKRGDLVLRIRDAVVLQVLDFDQYRREFQVSQEIARRSQLRLKLVELDYRLASGTMTTPGYLSELSALDQQKAQTFRAWAKVRVQLVRVKLLVLPNEN